MSRRRLSLLVAGLAVAAVSGCAKEVIAHQQTEAQAIRIMNLLTQEGIEVTKLKDEASRDLAFNLQVAKVDEAKAYSVLVRHNLPETKRDGTSEMFKEGGMIPTAEQQRAKREVGVAGDIVNSLRKVPRVVDASALVSIPEDNPLRDVNEAKPKPKASVMVSYLPDDKGQAPLTVEDVQRFVQASLPELRSTEVSVQLIAQSNAGAAAAGGMALSANACEKTAVIGVDVCVDHKTRLFNILVGAILIAGVLATMSVLAVLRALRYRKDLTRLTAQVAQLKK